MASTRWRIAGHSSRLYGVTSSSAARACRTAVGFLSSKITSARSRLRSMMPASSQRACLQKSRNPRHGQPRPDQISSPRTAPCKDTGHPSPPTAVPAPKKPHSPASYPLPSVWTSEYPVPYPRLRFRTAKSILPRRVLRGNTRIENGRVLPARTKHHSAGRWTKYSATPESRSKLVKHPNRSSPSTAFLEFSRYSHRLMRDI